MTRLSPVPYEEWDDEALRPLTGGRKVPPSNVLGLLLHHPELARSFLTFSAHLLARNSLPERTRELAILRVAWRRGCGYEWAQHVLIGRRAGVTDEDLDHVRTGARTLVNRAVDELETSSTLSDSTYAELARIWDERQLLDFVFTVGAYGMLAAVLNTFEVEPDAGPDDEGHGPARSQE
ncbi:MAG TPA: carboxymuconolactone decarboxylase family protein [Streptomyces sp.]|uniref:carboxymuconolactone decarboxylase family protein n=1 Tax=Streptomyces sp. TaxID=1931 RepID=UPI002CD255FE|nr:carboxymuconolactone decarboxylase family protein [Streptomyces sp.]HWU06426.1 carboxymuconolactone decarboxylase family protein [Streptomyces sp.]